MAKRTTTSRTRTAAGKKIAKKTAKKKRRGTGTGWPNPDWNHPDHCESCGGVAAHRKGCAFTKNAAAAASSPRSSSKARTSRSKPAAKKKPAAKPTKSDCEKQAAEFAAWIKKQAADGFIPRAQATAFAGLTRSGLHRAITRSSKSNGNWGWGDSLDVREYTLPNGAKFEMVDGKRLHRFGRGWSWSGGW